MDDTSETHPCLVHILYMYVCVLANMVEIRMKHNKIQNEV